MSDIVGMSTPVMNLAMDNMVSLVRSYLRDYAALNRLVAGETHSNRQIAWAIVDTVEDFNMTPPLTRFGLVGFPSRNLLIRGSVIALLESEGLLMTRNHLTFSDGGIQVGQSDKTPLIQSWIQLLSNKYEEKKVQLKKYMNIEGAWGGGVHSEYLGIGGYYGG